MLDLKRLEALLRASLARLNSAGGPTRFEQSEARTLLAESIGMLTAHAKEIEQRQLATDRESDRVADADVYAELK